MRKPVFNHLTKVETFAKSHDDAVFAADRRLAQRFATVLRKHLSQFNLQRHYVKVFGEDDEWRAAVEVYPNAGNVPVFRASVSHGGAFFYHMVDEVGDETPLPHRKYMLRAVMYDLLRALSQIDPRALAHINGETVG